MAENSLPKIMLGKAKRVNMLENTIEYVNPAYLTSLPKIDRSRLASACIRRTRAFFFARFP